MRKNYELMWHVNNIFFMVYYYHFIQSYMKICRVHEETHTREKKIESSIESVTYNEAPVKTSVFGFECLQYYRVHFIESHVMFHV